MDLCLLLGTMVISLVLTIVLEELSAIIIGIRSKRDLVLLCLVNILTNPAVVFIYNLSAYYTDINRILVQIILEFAAVMAEGLYFKAYGTAIRRPFIFSIYINVFSFSIGKLLSMHL